MYRLFTTFKEYEWGKIGPESTVFALLQAQGVKPLSDSTPYAEMWFGSHPNGESQVEVDSSSLEEEKISDGSGTGRKKILLKELIQEYKTQETLSFLFKVLSTRKALSIQVHPDKKKAEILNKLKPDVYKDSNHKPEFIVALSEVEALISLQNPSKILSLFQKYYSPDVFSSLASLKTISAILQNQSASPDQVTQALTQSFLSISPTETTELVSMLKSAILKTKKEDRNLRENSLLLFAEEYPSDIGILFSLMMNYVQLKPGDSMFIHPGEPHAYLRGDLFECISFPFENRIWLRFASSLRQAKHLQTIRFDWDSQTNQRTSRIWSK